MRYFKTRKVNVILSIIFAIIILFNSSSAVIMAENGEEQAKEKPVYCFLGSSVTYGHTTNGVSFVDHLAKDNDWECIKRAVSGTTLVDNGPDSYVQRMIKQIKADTHIDHFICQLSTNDASQRKPLGEVSESRELKDFNTTTIIGAMEYIIAYVYETWDCPVTFYTNPYYNNEYYEKMIDALYDLQEKWDIGIIDFYYYKDMDPLSGPQLGSFMSDPIHPNARGYRWMADVMGELLIKEDTTTEPTEEANPTDSVNNNKGFGVDVKIILIISLIIIVAIIFMILAFRKKDK